MHGSKKKMREIPHVRPSALINPELEKKLGVYLAAAGAASLGLMTVSTPAEAKVVYTPAHITVTLNSSNPIDLNGDGIADLTIQFLEGSHSVFLYGTAPTGNGLRLNASNRAAAGFFGIPVGPGEKFGTRSVALFGEGQYGTFSFKTGQWFDVGSRYLGVKFLISGQTHYGWVRMYTNNNIVVTGYAYETTPNHSIKEGEISGPAKSSIGRAEVLAPKPQPASLGLLARGWAGIAIWRKEEDRIS